MGDLFKPLDFTAIVGYPHQIPDKSIKKVPSFHGNDVITAKSHLLFFAQCYANRCHNVNFEDVKMRLFALSLEADVFEWSSNLAVWLMTASKSSQSLRQFSIRDGVTRKRTDTC